MKLLRVELATAITLSHCGLMNLKSSCVVKELQMCWLKAEEGRVIPQRWRDKGSVDSSPRVSIL